MRIGLISGEYPPMQGGISTQTRLLAEKLAQEGHDVFVLSSLGAREQVKDVTLHRIPNWGYGGMRRVVQWAREHQLDVVNMHYQTAAYNMSPFIHFLPDALRGTTPFIATFHDLRFPYLFPKAGPLRDWIVMRLARASAGVVATNQEDAARLASHSNKTLIPIASNVLDEIASDANARTFVGADGRDMVLAFFGFVNRTKGLEDLLAAMVNVRERGITPYLLMVGDKIGTSDPTNIPYAEEIDALIARYGLHDQIKWTGYVDDGDVRGYLTTADAVVMPFRDGASYRRSSMIVAIHMGCAIVTTTPVVDVPAFKHEENLLLVPPNERIGQGR
ncbi:MAG: glycosyltransferase family 4 protein, partial [Chloroflexota bacterium]